MTTRDGLTYGLLLLPLNPAGVRGGGGDRDASKPRRCSSSEHICPHSSALLWRHTHCFVTGQRVAPGVYTDACVAAAAESQSCESVSSSAGGAAQPFPGFSFWTQSKQINKLELASPAFGIKSIVSSSQSTTASNHNMIINSVTKTKVSSETCVASWR